MNYSRLSLNERINIEVGVRLNKSIRELLLKILIAVLQRFHESYSELIIKSIIRQQQLIIAICKQEKNVLPRKN